MLLRKTALRTGQASAWRATEHISQASRGSAHAIVDRHTSSKQGHCRSWQRRSSTAMQPSQHS